jgi:hypothetical protein
MCHLDSVHCNSHLKGQLICVGCWRKQCIWVVFIYSVTLLYRPTSFPYPPFSLFILFPHAPSYFIRTLQYIISGEIKIHVEFQSCTKIRRFVSYAYVFCGSVVY